MHSVLIEGLARQGRGPLAAQIALWDDSGIWTTAYSQARQKLGAKAPTPAMPRDHETRSVGELRILVLARLLDAVGGRFPERLSDGHLHELGLAIEQAAVQALTRTDKTFTGVTIDDMTRHMLHKAAKVVEAAFAGEPGARRGFGAGNEAGTNEPSTIRSPLCVSSTPSPASVQVAVTTGYGAIMYASTSH